MDASIYVSAPVWASVYICKTLALCISYPSVGVTFRCSKRSTFRRSKRSTFRRSKRTPDLHIIAWTCLDTDWTSENVPRQRSFWWLTSYPYPQKTTVTQNDLQHPRPPNVWDLQYQQPVASVASVASVTSVKASSNSSTTASCPPSAAATSAVAPAWDRFRSEISKHSLVLFQMFHWMINLAQFHENKRSEIIQNHSLCLYLDDQRIND